MSASPTLDVLYECPGDGMTIDRSVHLGRLAAFYPKCRDCQHRDDIGTLPTATVRAIEETHRRAAPAELFGEEALCGVLGNQIDARVVYKFASALGIALLAHGAARRFRAASCWGTMAARRPPSCWPPPAKDCDTPAAA